VSYCGLAIYIQKKNLKAKEEELLKLKYFTMKKTIIFKKNPHIIKIDLLFITLGPKCLKVLL
jgi:hypothetical protein